MIGPVLLIVVALALGAVRPGYSAWHTYVSMLSRLKALEVRMHFGFVAALAFVGTALLIARRFGGVSRPYPSPDGISDNAQ